MTEMYDSSYDDGESELPVVQSSADTGAESTDKGKPEPTEADRALVQKKLKIIKADKRHFKKHFDRMKRDMFMAYHGRDTDWPEKSYKANVVGRHINQKTASIYAKNPKVVARRKATLDFAVWDEDPKSLLMAMQVLQANAQLIQATAIATQQYQAAMAAAQGMMPPAQVDPATQQPVPPLGTGGDFAAPQPPPPLPPEVLNAQAIVADVQKGMQKRQLIEKFGKTLEFLYTNAMRAQTPLDFKSGMKTVVRRASTTAAGYVELDFQRDFGVPQAVNNQLDDARTRLQHLKELMEDAAEGEIDDSSAEKAELEEMIANLEAEPQVCIRSGLTFAWHQSTKVIPDRITKSFAGFQGARHLTVEEVLPKKDAEEKYEVELGSEYTPYNVTGEREGELRGVDTGDEDFEGAFAVDRKDEDMVCIYRHFDKRAGLLYVLCDGHRDFLQPPAAPNVKVPRFWPIYGLMFNQTESETEVFNPSDVTLLRDQQNERNRSRQGKREHRAAARPRFVAVNGTFDSDKDLPTLENGKAFEIMLLSGDPQSKIGDRLQPFPMPGVDPNLYDTNEVDADAMQTVGASPSQLGGTSKSTATEAAIADGAVSTSDSSSIDDLDAFLTDIARDGAIILQENMTKEDVVRQVGVGAVWVEDLTATLGMTPEDIYEELHLEVEMGSSGKPNQPQEVRNFKELAPLLLQIPGIPPEKLAKEAVRRLDDRLDLNEWFVEGLPAMVAANRAQPMQGGDNPAQQDPNQQGSEGGDKSRPPGGPAGTGPAFGSNQV